MEENWKDYYHKGLAAFLTVAMCILFFFMVFRFAQIQAYAKMIMKILRPFAFGAVIAYLLSPLCNHFERYLADISNLEKRPAKSAEKLRKFFGGVSIFLSLFLFCFVIPGAQQCPDAGGSHAGICSDDYRMAGGADQ